MRNSLRKFGMLLAAALLCSATSAFANTVTMTLTGTGSNGSVEGFVVYPYYFTINSQTNVPLVCDDFNDEIQNGESWTANVIHFGTINAANIESSGLQFTGARGHGAATDYLNYEEEAWLEQQMVIATGSTVIKDIQAAMWAIFATSDQSNLESDSNGWYTNAVNAVTAGGFKSSSLSNVTFYTYETGTAIVNQVGNYTPQEFSQVPEVSTASLFGVGLVGLALLLLRRRVVTV